jgi:uncharacterized protein YjbJ (UPF0337 family)
MTWDDVAHDWNPKKNELRQHWARLTADDLDAVAGKKEVLVSKLEQRYGILEEKARVEIDEWLERRSPLGAVKSYWESVVIAVALGAVLAALTFGFLPWGGARYVVVAIASLILMAILFRRRHRLEF